MLARRLKELRLEKGLKLREIADYMNVTVRAISRYETGEREPSVEQIIKFCDLFDVSADYLIGRSDSY